MSARVSPKRRRIHEGEPTNAHSRDRVEAQALAEDGIEVMALPDFLDDDRLQ